MTHPAAPKHTSPMFSLQFILSAALLLLLLWLATGTMAPYATTLDRPLVLPCGYLANVDHEQYRATFLLLDGYERKFWKDSVVLRRILFPLLAYPAMKLWGYEVGGFLTSLFLHLAAFIVFIRFLQEAVGEFAAVCGMWLLATYPGVTYWGGLPYANAAIVPCSLLATVLLWQLNEARAVRRVVWLALLLGVLFTAYDLLPFFGLAVLLIIWRNRQYRFLPWVALTLMIPQALVSGWLKWVYAVRPLNSNTVIYYTIVRSYFHWPDFGQWAMLLTDIPRVAAQVYLFSNFLFLPLFFLLLWALNRWEKRVEWYPVEQTVLWAALLLFLFTNLAPPYEGRWQLRGDWIARLYQPIFAVLLLFSVRRLQAVAAQPGWLKTACLVLFLATVVLQAAFSAGPVLHNPYAGELYYRFYKREPPESFAKNLAHYGRRPLGFCDPSL